MGCKLCKIFSNKRRLEHGERDVTNGEQIVRGRLGEVTSGIENCGRRRPIQETLIEEFDFLPHVLDLIREHGYSMEALDDFVLNVQSTQEEPNNNSKFRLLLKQRTATAKEQNCKQKQDSRERQPTFLTGLILLSGPNKDVVPRQESRPRENGHNLTGCSFTKGLSAAAVEIRIIEAFDGKIPSNVEIEILTSIHNSLVAPSLAPGQPLDGVMLHRIFKQKPVYVRPSCMLLNTKSSKQSRQDDANIPDNAFNSDDVEDQSGSNAGSLVQNDLTNATVYHGQMPPCDSSNVLPSRDDITAPEQQARLPVNSADDLPQFSSTCTTNTVSTSTSVDVKNATSFDLGNTMLTAVQRPSEEIPLFWMQNPTNT
ncbi:uncharacterized protein LOC124443689 [Xenia sp. Carnegie-2017]|uniref:uncharacterized protein LOC124443689 n=1 Tax=Xenia sp. Carnegie-2017 TaxID=2897299 RepID=UPI001F04093F|nr:uncharacterized protein LOC124443689 [Xenia sp. Carnegie-2017]